MTQAPTTGARLPRTRKALGITLAILGVFMLAVTLTVPMVASGGPAIIAALLFGGAYVAWPR